MDLDQKTGGEISQYTEGKFTFQTFSGADIFERETVTNNTNINGVLYILQMFDINNRRRPVNLSFVNGDKEMMLSGLAFTFILVHGLRSLT